ncbi:MAG: T9SS type A sorting domain-containing protein [Bacteroidota bacterium]
MKKIYLITGAAFLSVSSFAQVSEAGKCVLSSSKPFTHVASSERLTNPDTTGIVNVSDFLPEFLPNGGNASIYGYLGGGFIYGNNVDGYKICAQGYQNVGTGSPVPVRVLGVILWFGAIESDAGSSATSKVVISAYDMAANKAYNTNGSGTFNSTTLNSPGPTGTAKGTADLLFSDIDTTGWNYVTFTTPPAISGDFALVVDASTLTAGDTVGLVSDKLNDAGNFDYAFHKVGTKWYVTDQIFSDPASPALGSGGLDNNIAIWAVVADATGVNEYFNGMKLTTYPNPTTERATIEYTLEKNSNKVSLVVFDQAGRKVIEKAYDSQSAGTYKIDLETANLNAGTYMYQLNANGRNFTKQFVVTK